ncbi:MAG: pilus assembly protein [Candidatus Obscuribacterales bacterium]|nr:pilus assembly protein [Candidatus Obscuribacterales bacterium]
MSINSNLKRKSTRKVGRPNSGAVTAEFAASLALILPMVLMILYASYEVAVALMIFNALDHSAHIAAMALSKAYGCDASCAVSSAKQQQVLSNITFNNIVVNPNQFAVTFPNNPPAASWKNGNSNVPIVTVACTYASGQFGLPLFPSPDPLQLGKLFKLQATASAYLEGF